MTAFTDLWSPSVAAGQTRTVQGAGVTLWASVTIENDTSVQLLVSNSTTPPSDQNSAWRVVLPGAIVQLPLGTPGVAYRLAAAPAAGGAVQTVLDTSYQPAGGNTGTVNVASGTLTVTGPVNVQTATGVNLSTFSGFATASTVSINSGTTTQSITLVANVQKLMLLYGQAVPGGASPVTVTITGDQTGTRYYRGSLSKQDTLSIDIAGSTPGALSLETSFTITIVAAVGGGDIVVVQSFAAPALSANDLYPTATRDAGISLAKNLFVHEAHAKQAAFNSIASATPVTLIAAPGTGFAIQLHRTVAALTAAVAGNILQFRQGATPLANLSGAGNGNYPIDWAGYTLPENTAFNIVEGGTAPTANWDVAAFYTILQLA